MGVVIRWLIMLALVLTYPAYAELYRYQDSEGRWHFTDRVPTSAKQKAESLHLNQSRQAQGRETDVDPAAGAGSTVSQEQGNDLEAKLMALFSPDTPVEIASIAVVGIESKLGAGSGFFLTDQGHIVTNKHVIRPSRKTDEIQEDLAKEEKEMKAMGLKLRSRHKKLKKIGGELDDYKAQIYGSDGKAAAVDEADYEYRYDEYKEHLDRWEDQNKKFQEWKKELTAAQREISWSVSMAQVAKTFKVRTKDQKVHRAQLVYVSDKYDLALLKIDDVKSPKLEQGDTKALSQGQLVFAIGSPLGQRDSVTSGVITRVGRSVVITDAQILPGNSGGPLIDDQGNVVAVNTVKVSQKRGQEGFGHSIPIEVVWREFQSKL